MSASVYPSTITALPDLRMADFALIGGFRRGGVWRDRGRRQRRRQDAAAETGGVAGRVADREEDPAPEAVVDAPAAPAGHGEAHFGQLGGADLALALQRPDQGIPVGRGEAKLGALDRLVREAPATQVGERRRAGLAVQEDRVVEGERRVQHLVEPLAARILAGGQ